MFFFVKPRLTADVPIGYIWGETRSDSNVKISGFVGKMPWPSGLVVPGAIISLRSMGRSNLVFYHTEEEAKAVFSDCATRLPKDG